MDKSEELLKAFENINSKNEERQEKEKLTYNSIIEMRGYIYLPNVDKEYEKIKVVVLKCTDLIGVVIGEGITAKFEIWPYKNKFAVFSSKGVPSWTTPERVLATRLGVPVSKLKSAVDAAVKSASTENSKWVEINKLPIDVGNIPDDTIRNLLISSGYGICGEETDLFSAQ